MVHNILRSKTGKFGIGAAVILVFIIGLLWINGKQESSVPENRETVAIKIPKPEAAAAPVSDASHQVEEERAIMAEAREPEAMMIDSEPVMESPETPVETLESSTVPEISIKELEREPEENVSAFAEIENDPIPAAEDSMVQAVAGSASNDPKEQPVAVPLNKAAEKKTALIRNTREEDKKEENIGVGFQNTEEELVLQDIRLSENLKGKVLEVWANKTVAKYKYFILGNPPRLVIDLPGQWKEPDFRIKETENDLISRIRLWRHDSKLRIVSDLTSNRSIKPVVSPNSEGVEFLLITD
ncbi:MAG: AMIN domain-containing protein [Pseudomonadota bacterium]